MEQEEQRVWTVAHRCTRCGGEAEQSFAEEVGRAGLRWWEAWRCAGCSYASEADGIDRLPDELRAHVLAAEGSFRVDVHPRAKLDMIALLRSEFGMTLPDAKVTFDLLPHGFRTGITRVEAQVVANRIPTSVAEVRIEREERTG